MDRKLKDFVELVWQQRRELKNLNQNERMDKIYSLYNSAGKPYKNRSRARQMVEIVGAAHKAIHSGQCYLQLASSQQETMAKDLLEKWGIARPSGEIILEKSALLVIHQKMIAVLTKNPDVSWPCLGGFWHLGDYSIKATKRLYLNIKTAHLPKCIEGLAAEWNKRKFVWPKHKPFYFKFDNPYGGGDAHLGKFGKFASQKSGKTSLV